MNVQWLLRQLFCLLLLAGTIQAKPVLLMGNSYGVYERQRWASNLLVPQGIQYVTSNSWVDPSQWGDYSAVMIADEPPQVFDMALDPQAATAFDTAIRQYLDNGGVVIFVEGALPRMLNLPNSIGNVPSWAAPWVGAEVIGRINNTSGYNVVYTASQNVYPWPANMSGELQSPNWGPYFYTLKNLKTTARPLVNGAAGNTFFTVNHYGKGKVVHLGRMLFRVLSFAPPVDGTNLQKALEKMVASISKPITRSPLLMMGGAYGEYDRNAWINSILLHRQIDFTNPGTWVDPTDWPEYSAVFISDKSPVQFDMSADPEAATQFDSRVRQYLANGGVLIFAENALSHLLSLPNGIGTVPAWAAPWVGATTVTRSSSVSGYQAAYTASDDVFPWPSEMALQSPQWGAYFYMLKNLSSAKAVVHDPANGNALVAVNRYGNGGVLFLGRMLFRVAAMASPVDPEPLRLGIEKSLFNLGAIRVDILALEEIRQRHQTSRNYVTWQRDPEIDLATYAYAGKAYRPRFSPLSPRVSEKITALSMDLGASEFYSKPINLFAFQNLSAMQVSVQAASGHHLPPAGAVKVARQTELAATGPNGVEDLHQERFWVKPLGQGETFPVAAGESQVLFVQVDSAQWSPGIHTFNLILNDGNQAQTLPVTVTIHPVTVGPQQLPRLGLFGSYFLNGTFAEQTLINGQLVGVSYNATTAAPILRAMRDMGSNAGYGSALDLNAIKIQSTGETLNAFINRRKTNPSLSLVENGSIPVLDFSGYDAKIAAIVAQGATRISYRVGAITSSTVKPVNPNDIIEKLTGEQFSIGFPVPQPLSEDWKTAFQGIWGQFAEYLNSKGFTELTYKYSDELSPEEIEHLWLPVCTLIKETGWMPEANLTTATVTVATLSLIANVADVFQFNENFFDRFLNLEATAQVAIPAGSIVTTYGSWGYYKSPSSYTRREWWELFAKGVDPGIEIYTYDRLQVFDGSTVFLSASAEGWRNGSKEAAYLQKLAERYEATESSTDPAVVAWRASVTDFFASLIGPETGAAPASPYFHGMRWATTPASGSMPDRAQLSANTAQLDASRRDLLQLLSSEP